MADKEARLIVKIATTGVEALSAVSSAVKKIGTWALEGAIAVAGFGAAAIKAFRGSEEASNALDQALANQGIYTKALSDDYKKMASELQKVTTFEDDAIVSAQAAIQSQIGQTKVTKELTEKILDFATVQKMDVVSAAQLVGKAIGTNTNSLARYGIEVDANASKQEKLAEVLKGIGDKFGGAARAQGEGLGSLEQLKNAAGDFMEEVGKRLAPAVVILSKIFTDFTESLSSNEQLMNNIKKAMEGVVIAGSVFKNVIFGLADAIGQVLGTAIGAITQLLDGQFKQAWTTIKDSAGGAVDSMVNRWQQGQQEIDTITTAFATKAEEQELNKLNRLMAISAEAKAAKLEEMALTQEEISKIQATNDENLAIQTLDAQMARIQKEIEKEKDKTKLLDLETKKRQISRNLDNAKYVAEQTALIKFNKWVDENHIKDKQQVFAQIATLSDSNNSTLVAIGKAAALAQISISTAEGVARALGSFPPPINFAFAAAVGAAGAVQASKVMGVKFAEGGIVEPRPGGVHAIIGEAGRSEAVIPLDDDRTREKLGMGGTTVNIYNYGGLLGDASSAREFALAIDRELYKLKRGNESMLAA